MKRLIAASFSLGFAIVLAAPALAQSADQSRAREAERNMDEGLLLVRHLRIPRFDFGGWWRGAYTQYSTTAASPKPESGTRVGMRSQDVVLWFSRPMGEHAQVYARGRASVLDFNEGDHPEGDDTVGPKLDVGFLRIDLARSLNAVTPGSVSEHVPRLELTLGRQYLVLGSGLLLNRLHDGADLRSSFGAWNLELFAARSIASQRDLDPSRPAVTIGTEIRPESQRFFYGLELSREGFLGAQRPYAIALYQEDRYRERPDVPSQEYMYDSRYFALGSAGPLAPRLRYHAELIAEQGATFRGNSTVDPAKIKAQALFLETEYRPLLLESTRLYLRFLHTTGDADRKDPSSTQGFSGRTDNGFQAFGYVPTGFVLAAAPSNLQVITLGASWKPFGLSSPARQPLAGPRTLELGAAIFRLRKDVTANESGNRIAGISDPTANLAHADIGLEADTWLSWKPATDLFVSARWGLFRPGEAYFDRESRQFMTVSLTLEF